MTPLNWASLHCAGIIVFKDIPAERTGSGQSGPAVLTGRRAAREAAEDGREASPARGLKTMAGYFYPDRRV